MWACSRPPRTSQCHPDRCASSSKGREKKKPPHKNWKTISFLSQVGSVVLSPSQSHSDKEGEQELSLLALHPQAWVVTRLIPEQLWVGWGTSPQHGFAMGTPHLSRKLKSILLERQASCLSLLSHLPGGHGQRVWMDRHLGTDYFYLLLLRVAAGHLWWQKKGLISLVPPKSPGPVLIPRGLSTFGVCTISESLIACPHATQLLFFPQVWKLPLPLISKSNFLIAKWNNLRSNGKKGRIKFSQGPWSLLSSHCLQRGDFLSI